MRLQEFPKCYSMHSSTSLRVSHAPGVSRERRKTIVRPRRYAVEQDLVESARLYLRAGENSVYQPVAAEGRFRTIYGCMAGWFMIVVTHPVVTTPINHPRRMHYAL